MTDLLNCPNCGAPIQDDICPYCGSVFLDWAAFDIQKPTFVKVRSWDGHIKLMKIATCSIDHVYESANEAYIYADDQRYFVQHSFPEIRFECEFTAEPFFDKFSNREVLSIDIDPKKADNEIMKTILGGIKDER